MLQNYSDMIVALQQIHPSAHIAGGAVRDTILERPIRDIDIFVADEAREAAAKLLRSKFGYVKVGEWQQYEHFSEPCITRVAKFERADSAIPLSVIGLDEDKFPGGITIPSNITRFDFGICMAAYDGREQVRHPLFELDANNSAFTLHRADNEEQFAYSMVRYQRLTKERYAGWGLAVPVKFEPLVAKVSMKKSWYHDYEGPFGYSAQVLRPKDHAAA
jgi:hypothetical protein